MIKFLHDLRMGYPFRVALTWWAQRRAVGFDLRNEYLH